MRFELVTIFPAMVDGPIGSAMIGRARARGLLEVVVHDLRDYADPPIRQVDDEVYGGGAGMLFRPEPLLRAVRALRRPGARAAVVLPTPSGEVFSQALARELAGYEQIVLLCDRYEGSDERVRAVVSHEVCVGEFVLTGGELAALVVLDVVARLVPGVVGRQESVEQESFTSGVLDHACYTRPEEYAHRRVPEVLLSGHHRRVQSWRQRSGLRRTLERRPDLLRERPLATEDCRRIDMERRARSN